MDLAPRLEGRIWLAHHAAFDGSFLKAQLPQGLWSRHRLACTRNLARRLVPEVPRRSLSVLCEHFGIVNARAHRALQDAEATAEVLQHLIQRAEERGLDAEGFLALGELSWAKL
jgi:DNA polymerase-3 subunit epsilon